MAQTSCAWTAERVPAGDTGDYLIRIEAWLPDDRAETCLAAVDNTAQSLGLAYTADIA